MASGESFLVEEQTDFKGHSVSTSTSTCRLVPDEVIDTKDGMKDGVKEEEIQVDLCKHFVRGRCHFGERCRLSHSMPSTDTAELPKDDLEYLENLEKEEKNKKNRKKMPKSPKKMKDFEDREPLKRPRMRTADDVINRILWDPAIVSADFVVGHIDRFLGVLERPFDEFSWDTSVTDCDYSEELALPRHRIQYFCYRGQRVWDRENRTDHIFGSTGQTVMPPFGGEVQQQGDVRQQEDNSLDSAEQQQMPLGEHEESFGNDTEAQTAEQENPGDTDNGICRAALDGTPLKDPGDASVREHQTGSDISSSDVPETGEVHSLGNSTQLLSISQKNSQIPNGEDQEWKSDWDGEEESELLEWQAGSPQSPKGKEAPSGDPEQPSPGAQVPRPVPQESKPRREKCRPTHFITFRVDTPAVLHAFQRLQAKVLAHLPQTEPHWVSPATLHVTLSLLVLPGPAEVFAASELLRTIVKTLHKPPISVTFTPKLKHFAGKVLHIVPQPLCDIQALNAPIQQAFREKGWLHRDSRCPSYHMTLAKVDDGDRPFENVGVIKLGKDINFGKLNVEKLCLCNCSTPKTTSGFYETICAVTIPEL